MQPKLLFASIALVFCLHSQAQFSKGTRMIGATIGSGYFTSGKTDFSNQGYTNYNHNWNVSFTPSIGWFINDGNAVGANLFVSSTHQKSWNEVSGVTNREDNSHNTDFGLGLFYRHYFKASSQLHPFVQAYVNGGSGVTKTDGFYYAPAYTQTYTGKTSDRFFYNAGLNLGLTKMLSNTVGAEAYVGYSHSYNKFTTKTVSTSVDRVGTGITQANYLAEQTYSGNNINVGIGLQVFLPGKK